MKLLHVMPSLDPRFGGPPVALAGYAKAAAALGHTVTVVAPDPGAGGGAWLAAAVPSVEIRTVPSAGALWREVGSVAASAEVVHVHGTLNTVSAIGMWRSIRADRPVVVRPFGTLSAYTFSRRRRTLKRAYHQIVDAPALRRAAALHFTTDAERDEALRLPAVRRDRSHVVPPPWVADGELPRRRRTDTATVLFLSRLDPKKGVEALLGAWPAVLSASPDAQLLIAGDGRPEYRAALEQRAATLGSSVRFTGFVDGQVKRQLLADASVFVLASSHENFGVAVLEALAVGIPVVISAGVGLAGFVHAHHLGAVVVAEPRSLSEAILAALADTSLRERCLTEGPRAVTATFGTAVVAQGLQRMYEAAIVAA